MKDTSVILVALSRCAFPLTRYISTTLNNNFGSPFTGNMADAAPFKRKAKSDARGNDDTKRTKVRSSHDAQELHSSFDLCCMSFWNMCHTAVKNDTDGNKGKEEVGNAKTRQC